MINIKHKFQFTVSQMFEPFFALQTLTDPDSRIHTGWKRRALQRIPASFHKKFTQLGGSPFLWPMVSDCLLSFPVALPFEEMISRLLRLPIADFQKTIFFGTFHEPAVVSALLTGRSDLFETVTRVSKAKKEWLGFIGLYPVDKKSPLFAGLESLLRTPKEFQKILAELLQIFWESDFKETWDRLYASLERSKDEKERLFQSCSLDEFARLALLRVEIDERRGLLQAVRGGYKLPLREVASVQIIPSAFNDKRHWTTYEGDPAGIVAYFPYFDPAISLEWKVGTPARLSAEAERDPALIFKALGDTTRYAMVSLLAKRPLTSADLAKTLALSRPTVSHHIHVLREAGLLEEKLQGNAVLLSLRREVLESLSELATRKLFRSSEEVRLTKTRKK